MRPLTYATLDALGEHAWEIFEPVLDSREDMPQVAWIDFGARTLATTSLRGEALGRSYGAEAVPMDGTALLPPDVTTTARRRAPEDFEQRSSLAPDPDPVLDVAGRFDELSGQYARSFSTLVSENGVPLSGFMDRFERLVVDETIAAVQRGYQDGIRLSAEPAEAVVRDQDGNVYEAVGRDEGGRPRTDALGRMRPRTSSATIRGYRRGINPGCCELCFWLWKEGKVYPIDQPMHRHTGCRCVPVPTTDPVGKWALSDEEMQLLDDLYDRYVH